jgi:hypothetical protein
MQKEGAMNGRFTAQEARHLSAAELLHYAGCGLVDLDTTQGIRLLEAAEDYHHNELEHLDVELGEVRDDLRNAEARIEEANQALEQAGLPLV